MKYGARNRIKAKVKTYTILPLTEAARSRMY
jgi:hypothetical protein